MRRVVLAIVVAVAATMATTVPASSVPVFVRIAGVDRYETAAKVSQQFFPTPGVPIVYLASGETFPDALAAGAAAADDGGPVLLTLRDTLPDVTLAELLRLQPVKVQIVGGTAAVSQAVRGAVESALPAADVGRVQGGDRYDTSVVISLSSFSPGVPVAYVASGISFADALAGSAVAGAEDGPLLLVERMSVPPTVRAELDRLDPAKIVVLGGDAAVSEAVLASLRAQGLSETVERRAGTDRYLTAVEVSKASFGPDVESVFLATGENFPDGLAGGAVAGGLGVPVLLTRTSCIPPAVAAEIARLAPSQVFVLGGEQAVAAPVLDVQTPCP